MSSTVNSWAGWLRRNLRWSDSRESWFERLGVALVLITAAFAFFVGGRLALSQRVLLWGLVLMMLAVLLRRGWLKLFGPVLFYDLMRVARRSRYFLIRSLYGFVLLAVLSWLWFIWYMEGRYHTLSPSDMAAFAGSFFYTFMTIQFLVVTLLTPAYTAGAISDEKERRTLEFLLATDLRNREIVLSKLLSRLANLTLLLLVGLPILGFLQFLGGVDPGLVLAGFAVTGLTVLSLAGLSIFFSVLVRKSRDAIVLTYLTAAGYVILASSSLLLLHLPSVASFPSTAGWSSPVTVQDLVEWLNAGNIIAQLINLSGGVAGGTPLDESLPKALRGYALFHGGVALICAVWAVLRLRAVFLSETYDKPQRAARGVRRWLRPPVGDHPMLWKEIFAEPRMRFHWVVRIFLALLIVASFVPVGFILAEFMDRYLFAGSWRGWGDPWRELREAMNVWVRLVGTVVACLLLLGVAVRAASSIGVERDRQTFDSLLTSPLDSTTILFAKWLASILSVRWGWLWLGAICALGLITTGLHPLAVPLLLAAWLIYAAFLATIGVWFSMVSRTTLRATLWTLLTTVGVAIGHWLIWACCIPLLIIGSSGPGPAFGDFLEWVSKFEAFGLTPPVTLGFLAFSGEEFEYHSWRRNEGLEFLACAIIGLLLYAGVTAFLWGGVSIRFRQLTGRTPIRPRRSRSGLG